MCGLPEVYPAAVICALFLMSIKCMRGACVVGYRKGVVQTIPFQTIPQNNNPLIFRLEVRSRYLGQAGQVWSRAGLRPVQAKNRQASGAGDTDPRPKKGKLE